MSLARVAQALGASTNSEATAGYAPVPPPGAPAAEHIDGVCSPSLTRTSQNDDDDGSRDMENGDGGSVEQSSARGCCVDGTLFRVSVIALLCAILLSVWTVLLRDTRLFDAGPLILQHGLLRAHDTPTLNRWALHFLALQKRFELLCNQGSNNRVQNRVDGSYPGEQRSASCNSHIFIRTGTSPWAPDPLFRMYLTGFRCFRVVCMCGSCHRCAR
jgi:hypothetical protein